MTVAGLEAALPQVLVNTAVYAPASDRCAFVIVSEAGDPLVGDESAPLAPDTVPPPAEAPPAPSTIGTPLRCHCTETLLQPLAAVAERVSVPPASSARACGRRAMVGMPVREYRAK